MNRAGSTALLLFGGLLIILFAGIAIAEGPATSRSASTYIAFVRDVPDGKGEISKERFDRAMLHAAASAGLNKVPLTVDPRYASLQEAAVNDLLQQVWLAGEAAEEGVTVTDDEVDTQLDSVRGGQFGNGSGFEKYLKSTKFTLAELRARMRLQLISQKIQDKVARTVTGADVKKYQRASKHSANGPRSLKQLVQEAQQAKMKTFIKNYNAKWISRTFCREAYKTSFCGNYHDGGRSQDTDQATSQ